MTRKEIHDVINFISPAISLSQNLLLGFHGEMVEEQHEAVMKIESCLKDLQGYLRLQGHQAEAK